MLCIRCGSSNPGQPRLCGQCGAVLPRNAGEEAACSPDDRGFEPPGVSYSNDALDALGLVIDRFFEDEAGFEEVEEKILVLEHRLATLLENLSPALEALRAQSHLLGDDSVAPQAVFLVGVGVARFNDAIDGLYTALEEENDESIDPLLAELTEGNDYICHAGTLMDRILTELENAHTP